MKIQYIDRQTRKVMTEKVYGDVYLRFLYGNSLISKFLAAPILYLLVKNPFFSWLYGRLQSRPASAKHIEPFIKKYQVDTTEFQDPVNSFSSFNDFFIRKLRPESRPMAQGEDVLVIPADGRYRFFQNINLAEGFAVKGEKFHLGKLLEDSQLAQKYEHGSMVMARLCPTDYHRYHFPCRCIPGETRYINGWLYSVNPIAIKKDIHIFAQNKRTICELETERFGRILFLEIGATNVGSIHQTYTPYKDYRKGDEKGYFSFGGSALILLFEPGRIQFDPDLLELSDINLEIRCLLGQPMAFSRRQDCPCAA